MKRQKASKEKKELEKLAHERNPEVALVAGAGAKKKRKVK